MPTKEGKIAVLITDDVAFIRKNVTFILKRSGFETFEAINGMEAYSIAKENKPDVILMDIMMPEYDGFEGLRLLKSDIETKNIPVIMLSAKSDREDILKARGLGARDYMIKPFKREELVDRINQAMVKIEKSIFDEMKDGTLFVPDEE